MKKKKLQNEFGFIEHVYYEPSEKYPNGLLLFMGSYVDSKFRGQGRFKELVKELFGMYPNGSTVQVPLCNKKLVPMFENLGFKEIESIEYWGNPSNSIQMEGTI